MGTEEIWMVETEKHRRSKKVLRTMEARFESVSGWRKHFSLVAQTPENELFNKLVEVMISRSVTVEST